METTKPRKFHDFVNLLLILGIVGHVKKAIECIIMTVPYFDDDEGMTVLLFLQSMMFVALAVSMFFILSKNKIGVYGFFAVQLANLAVKCAIDGDWMTHLGVSVAAMALMSGLLCIRSNGRSAWTVLTNKE